MSKYFLSIDSGSHTCRSALIDKEGKIVKLSSLELPSISLKPHWVEYDLEKLWELQYKTILDVLEGIDPKDIISLGISNQRETIVAWDRRTGIPVYNAISWQDRRNSEFLISNIEDKEYIRNKTGLTFDLYFSASKIDWILKNCKYDWRYLCVGTLDSWILWKLTNGAVFATDVSNASRTMLLDIESLKWDEYILFKFKFPIHIFPEIFSSATFFGYWEYEGHKIEILGVLGDQQAALLGAGGVNVGDVKCTYGTGAFLLSNIGYRSVKNTKLIKTIAWKIGNGPVIYACESGSFVCGNALEWAKNNGYLEHFHNLDSDLFEPVFFCQS